MPNKPKTAARAAHPFGRLLAGTARLVGLRKPAAAPATAPTSKKRPAPEPSSADFSHLNPAARGHAPASPGASPFPASAAADDAFAHLAAGLRSRPRLGELMAARNDPRPGADGPRAGSGTDGRGRLSDRLASAKAKLGKD